MSTIRAAIFFASADKYVTTLLSIATTAIVARLIGPAECRMITEEFRLH